MKKAAIIALAIVLSLGTLAGIGFAVGHRFCTMTPAQRADRVAGWLAKGLDLTKEQQAKLNSMKAEVVDRMVRLHADREKVQGEVTALIKSDRITEGDVLKVIEEREARFQELKPFLADKIVEFHTMLTPAQRIKLAEKMEAFHNRCGHFQ